MTLITEQIWNCK